MDEAGGDNGALFAGVINGAVDRRNHVFDRMLRGERIIHVKAIRVDNDHDRDLVQKTLLGSLNRAKQTIARVRTAGGVSWRLI